jgi:hypothetical protein
MNAMMRPVIIGCFMGLLALCVFGLRFSCTAPDFQEQIRSAKLAEMRRANLDRLEARDQVVRALIAQRCTVAEAIEQFLELDRQWPDVISKVLAYQSQEERVYQNIRLRVKEMLHDHPEQASIVLRRLEQEYEKLRADGQTRSAAETEPVEPRSLNKK